VRAFALIVLGALLGACASPAARVDRLAARAGFGKAIVVGARFRHVVYRNSAQGGAGVLHVYIEGDGSPFEQRNLIAADPTPRAPLMLSLMAEDPAPSIYLGRPCYFGLQADAGCGPLFWTFRRFAPEVIDSMESALRAEIARSGARHVDLFGHSGGAALAVLLAQRVNSVVRVVTIGAPLDIAAWCKLHGYSPLAGSVNPVEAPPGRPGLEFLHLVGEKDANTPPALVETAARARGGEPVRVLAGLDHQCCWAPVWRGVLSTMP
jgi:hypothetical protein